MKKNFLIMMIMLLCSGFAFAQINTVRGFVPGAGTGNGNATDGYQTYAVFGQMFGNIDLNAANPYEVAEGLAQAQLIADTVEAVVGCGDSLKIGDFTLSAAAIDAIVAEFAADPTRPRDTFLTLQRTNAAIYNYDRLMVLHLFVCPCTIKDINTNEYEVVAIDNICWTKTNMRATTTCGGTEVVTKSYSTDVTPELDPATFGLLYTWENASKDSKCDSNYVTGICPCGWHLPTAAEVDTILKSYTNDLRSNGGYWVVPEGITNLTKFTAEPAGYFDSLATRFEGFHSEADFWYVATDSTCNADYFQIYYFCDKPKHEPRNVNTDAMSVRCVLDMIYDYHKDDPTPNPQPQPTPTKTCNVSSVTVTPDQNDPKSIMITITPVTAPLTAEDLASVKVTVTSYTVLNGAEAVEVTSNPETVNLDNLTADGTLTWTYNPTVGDQLQAITGIVNVDGVTSGSEICGAEESFNTAPVPTPDCPTLTLTPVDYGTIEGKITPYSANDNYSIDITGVYVGIQYMGDNDIDGSPMYDTISGEINETIDQDIVDQDGNFTWTFELDDYDVIRMSGAFEIEDCPQTFEFNTAQAETCDFTIGNLTANTNGVEVQVTNYNPEYFSVIEWEYAIDGQWAGTIYVDPSDITPGVDGVATITMPQLPVGAVIEDVVFELNWAYRVCNPEGNIIRVLDCPTYGVASVDQGDYTVYVPVTNYVSGMENSIDVSYTFYTSVDDQEGVTINASEVNVVNTNIGHSLEIKIVPEQIPGNPCGLQVNIQSWVCQGESQTLLICE